MNETSDVKDGLYEKAIRDVESYLRKLNMEFEADCILQEFLGKSTNVSEDSISKEKEDKTKELLDKLYRLNYWFCNEMLTEEQHIAEFEEACKEAEDNNDNTILITVAPGNAKCMKGCMEDTVKVINYLRKKENLQYIDSWQLAGAEAMFAQCKKDSVIPYDLPGTLMAVLGMWNELESELKK